MRHLIDEGFDGERGVRAADHAPPQDRYGVLGGRQFHRDIGNGVGNGRGTFHRGRIDSVLDHDRGKQGIGHDRLADDDVTPAGELALVVQARFELVKIHGPIQAAMDDHPRESTAT
jgi:hypothetical protein